jgi:undecaprenyl-diphosphatase
MTLFHLVLFAIVQGITEFLPISSSGHLILMHQYLGTAEVDALALDVAVHLGSILAVILYFRAEVARAVRGGVELLRGRLGSPDSFLALCLVIATIPAVILGGILAVTGWVDALRNLTVIGWTMILFGLALWWIDRRSPEDRALEGWTLKHALRIGLWQAVALIPGVSRSGITITAARGLGYTRRDAARISMLMSIPITLATGGVLALDALKAPDLAALLVPALVGAVLAFVAAYLALSLMMRFLAVVSFTPYVIYRVLLGAVLLWIAYA